MENVNNLKPKIILVQNSLTISAIAGNGMKTWLKWAAGNQAGETPEQRRDQVMPKRASFPSFSQQFRSCFWSAGEALALAFPVCPSPGTAGALHRSRSGAGRAGLGPPVDGAALGVQSAAPLEVDSAISEQRVQSSCFAWTRCFKHAHTQKGNKIQNRTAWLSCKMKSLLCDFVTEKKKTRTTIRTSTQVKRTTSDLEIAC